MNSKVYCDIAFPLRLGTLTYLIPEELTSKVGPGSLVEAPLRKRLMRGVVLRVRNDAYGDASRLKEIIAASPFLREEIVKLLEWAAEHYMAEEGTLLRSMVPSFIFRNRRLKLPEIFRSSTSFKSTYSATLIMEDVLRTGRLLKLLEEAERGAIILVPSVEWAEEVYKNVSDSYRDRLIFYHSRLKSSELRANYTKLLNPQNLSHIVIGTRNAVFSPFKPSVIIVLDEASGSYKQEETPSFNARDMAVMRAYIEGIPVYLCSEAPSLESIYNAKVGKYKLVKTEHKKKISIMVNRIKRGFSETELFPERLLKKIERVLKKDEKILLSLPRSGYSFIYCRDCGKVLRCDCEGAFIFYKSKKYLKCRICDNVLALPDLCPHCRGTELNHLSAGIERIEEFIKERFSSFALADSTDGITISPSPRLLYGENYYLGVILDADIFLNMPDYRASERLFHEVYYLAQRIKDGGEIILQTRIPEYEVFNYIRRFDYMGFALSELKMRRIHKLPPFSRLVILRIFSRKVIDYDRVIRFLKDMDSSVRQINLRKRKKTKASEAIYLLRLDRTSFRTKVGDIIRFSKEEGLDVRCYVDPL
ncbi:MAG: hypothetical protein N2257_04955 [Thermodesulfovibrionales bacterium]|nr:hypothetical protein [Thermodesulfovibrionales bacterium]